MMQHFLMNLKMVFIQNQSEVPPWNLYFILFLEKFLLYDCVREPILLTIFSLLMKNFSGFFGVKLDHFMIKYFFPFGTI